MNGCRPPDRDEVIERELRDRIRAGDEHALGLLLARHRSGLELLCHLMLGDVTKARIAMADTAIAAWDERSGLDSAASARVWLYKLALRACFNTIQRQR